MEPEREVAGLPGADDASGPGHAPGSTGSDQPAGAPPTTKDIKPSIAWIWIGVAILVLGIGGGFALVLGGAIELANAPNDYERINVPGERKLNFSQPGTHTFYGETDDYGSYRGFSSSYTINPPVVTVTDAAGAPVSVSRDTRVGSSDYTRQGYRAYSFATVNITSAGVYTVSVKDPVIVDRPARSPSSSRSPSTSTPSSANYYVARVAVGPDLTGAAVTKIGGGFLLGSIAILVGLVLLIVIAVKRSGSRRKLFPPPARLPAYGPGGPYAGPPAGAYGAGAYGAGASSAGPFGAPPPSPYGPSPSAGGPYPGGSYGGGAGSYGVGAYGPGAGYSPGEPGVSSGASSPPTGPAVGPPNAPPPPTPYQPSSQWSPSVGSAEPPPPWSPSAPAPLPAPWQQPDVVAPWPVPGARSVAPEWAPASDQAPTVEPPTAEIPDYVEPPVSVPPVASPSVHDKPNSDDSPRVDPARDDPATGARP